jgi:hypothetical protein
MVKVKVQVVIEYEDDASTTLTEEIHCLDRQEATLETLGLTLAEGKEVLSHLQKAMITIRWPSI